MKADISRWTFDPSKQYGAVLMQQGRVQLDADWNEQQAIHRHRAEALAGDAIGASGVPIDGASGVASGFAIKVDDEGKLRIGKGRYYVDGVLCLNEGTAGSEDAIAYQDQPHPSAELDLNAFLSPPNGAALVYLEVWERHVTPIDDPDLLEPALDGPDTTTRAQVVWQVKVVGVDRSEAESHVAPCAFDFEAWTKIVEPWSESSRDGEAPGTMAVQPRQANGRSGASGGDYAGLENQLYRVEIRRGGVVGPQAGGDQPAVEYVWSRENGAVMTGVVQVDVLARRLTVASLNRDERVGFAHGDIVEVLDDHSEFGATQALDDRGEIGATADTPFGRLFTIAKIDDERRDVFVTGDGDALAFLNELAGDTSGDRHIRLRRWDGHGTITAGEEIDLEHNLQVRFTAGRYRTGDYWQIPARADHGRLDGGQGAVLWPRENDSFLALPSAAPRHHFCRLALIEPGDRANGSPRVIDCRRRFPQLTGLIRLVYLDGNAQVLQVEEEKQEEPRDIPLPLVVKVVNWDSPVAGALVSFTVVKRSANGPTESKGGKIEPGGFGTKVSEAQDGSSIVIATNGDGLASARWKGVAGDPADFFVEATLVIDDKRQTQPPPIRFTSSRILQGSDALEEVLRITDVRLIPIPRAEDLPNLEVGELLETGRPLYNDGEVTVAELHQGIVIACDGTIDPLSLMYVGEAQSPQETTGLDKALAIDHKPDWRGNKPVVTLTVEQPTYLSAPSGTELPVGSSPVVIASRVARAADKVVVWEPADNRQPEADQPIRAWLAAELETRQQRARATEGPTRFLTCLRVKGNAVWSQERQASGALKYLDGEAFAAPRDPTGATELALPSGNRRRGGDFELWFWVARHLGIGLIPNMRWFSSNMVKVLDLALDRARLEPTINGRNGILQRPGVRALIGEGDYEVVVIDGAADKASDAFDDLEDDDRSKLIGIRLGRESFLGAVAPQVAVVPKEGSTEPSVEMTFSIDETAYGDDIAPDPTRTVGAMLATWTANPARIPQLILGTRMTADLLRERALTDRRDLLEGVVDGTFVRI